MNLINVIDPPTYETLEAMIATIEANYSGASASSSPSATPSPSN
jgi:hypothetical protein